jgi:hypothetical protein
MPSAQSAFCAFVCMLGIQTPLNACQSAHLRPCGAHNILSHENNASARTRAQSKSPRVDLLGEVRTCAFLLLHTYVYWPGVITAGPNTYSNSHTHNRDPAFDDEHHK